MATERDELAEIVYNQASGCDADGNVTKRAALRTADYLIAAGFRRVGPDEVIVDRETVAAAVAVAKSFTPRWSEYECFTQMEEALGDE